MRFCLHAFFVLSFSLSLGIDPSDCGTPLTLHVTVLHDNRFMLGHRVDLLINFEDVHMLSNYS